MATHSSTLTWKIPRIEEPGRLQSMESKELDMTEWIHFLPFLYRILKVILCLPKSEHFCGFWVWYRPESNHWSAGWPWAKQITSLTLSFPFCLPQKAPSTVPGIVCGLHKTMEGLRSQFLAQGEQWLAGMAVICIVLKVSKLRAICILSKTQFFSL